MELSHRKPRIAFWFAWRIALLSFLLPGIVPAQSPREKMDGFAKCLTQKHAVMYGSFLCTHCEAQRKMFGDSFKYIHYVECSSMGVPQDLNACKSAQIRYTPTWSFENGERVVGTQTLKTLSEKTGCALP